MKESIEHGIEQLKPCIKSQRFDSFEPFGGYLVTSTAGPRVAAAAATGPAPESVIMKSNPTERHDD